MKSEKNDQESLAYEKYKSLVAEIATGKRIFSEPSEEVKLSDRERIILAEVKMTIIPLFTPGRLPTEIQSGFTAAIKEPFLAEMGINLLHNTLSKFFVSAENK